MRNNSQSLLLRVHEAAARLGLGRSTIYALIKAGDLPVVHIGRSARIPATAVERFVERLEGDETEAEA